MHRLFGVGKLFSNWLEINPTTLTGAIDVVVVEQPNGTFTCSPFHVRFGNIGVLRSKEKVVDIEVNGIPVDIHMKLGESGEAFFVEEVSVDELGDASIPAHLACSPIAEEETIRGYYMLNDSTTAESDVHQNLVSGESEETDKAPGILLMRETGSMKICKGETVQQESKPERTSSCTSDEFSQESDSSSEVCTTCNLSENGTGLIDLSRHKYPLPEGLKSSSTKGSKNKYRKKLRMKKKSRKNIRRKKYTDQIDDKCKEQGESVCKIEVMNHTPPISNKESKETLNIANIKKLSDIKNASMETEIHFFSDTELTPGFVLQENILSGQVQSDSEYETKRGISKVDCKVKDKGRKQSWPWGELPTPATVEEKVEANHSWLYNMFWFLKRTKHIRHNTQEGMYPSDINADEPEPETAALCVHTDSKQTEITQETNSDDRECVDDANVVSLTTGKDGVYTFDASDSDFEDLERFFSDISLSLCGGLTTMSCPSEEAFHHHIITYDEFLANPTLINNPNLVIRVNGKMYNWHVAGPIILSYAAFHKPLSQPAISKLCEEFTPQGDSDRENQRISYDSWLPWDVRETQSTSEITISLEQSTVATNLQNAEYRLIEKEIKDKLILNPQAERKNVELANINDKYQESSSSDCDSDSDKSSLNSRISLCLPRKWIDTSTHRKTLRLTSEQISNFNLLNGANEVEFSVTTAFQGTTKCKCFLFKWRFDDKIVVSDIDGTITKSDFLGHILPIVGKDWSQSGVAELFSKIKDNGYQLLYLSSRAIGQSQWTRDYLQSIKQGDLTLPEGPILLSPTGLISALHTQVIEKKPEQFKISCLRDVQALFPPQSQPFYAGYGNTIHDVWTYQAVGIPLVRIFTINHRGEIRHELTQTFQSSFPSMSHIVNLMFPTKCGGEVLLEEFSQFNYWREHIAEIDQVLT